MAKAKDTPGPQKQPRSLAPDLIIQQPGLHRAGLHLELQKFKNREKFRQLLLTEPLSPDQDIDSQLEAFGLELSVSQEKALTALQKLLEETDYKGNIPGEERSFGSWKWRGQTLTLSVTYPEYLEAFGLSKGPSGRYSSSQRKEALKALESLEEPFVAGYYRQRHEGQGKRRRPVYDAIVTKKPLISITRAYKGLTEEELAKVKAGQDVPGKRHRGVIIEFSPIFFDQIETFFLLKPNTLFQEIEEHLGKKRYSEIIPRFINLLLTVDRQPFKISQSLLVEKLRMDSLKEQRHKARIQARLQEAYDVAKGLGFIRDYEQDTFGTLTFWLNPERCKRVRPEEPDNEEEAA